MNKIGIITFATSVALSIASAFCTVVGIGNIFTSAPITTMIIASIIEFGRAVILYDLHHFWNKINLIKKTIALGMIIIAMSLSAMGVFGFFANAYSAKTNDIIPMELEISQLEESIRLDESQIEMNNVQIKNIQDAMSSKAMTSAIDKYIEKEYVSKALSINKESQKQISSLHDDNKKINQGIIDKRKQITELKIQSEKTAPSIAHLKYFSKLFNTSNDNAIIIFIVMIMLVFDTMAMYLMVTADWVFNLKKEIKIVEIPVKRKYTKHKKEQVPTITEVIDSLNKSESNDVEDIEETRVIENNEEKKIFIDKHASKLIRLLEEDSSILDNKKFMDSLLKTPYIAETICKYFGKNNEITTKIRKRMVR